MMRNYGVQSKCMLLKLNEFKDLYEKYNEEIDIDEIFDVSYEITNACIFTEFDGVFNLFDENGVDYEKAQFFDRDDIIIFELNKDTLFDCYKDFNEIYSEIVENLKEVNINVDEKYIKEHFGILEGSYYA